MHDYDAASDGGSKYQAALETLLGVTLRPNAQGQVYIKCPMHSDRRPSLSINVRKGVWFCHGGCGSGTVQSLARKLGATIATRATGGRP